MLTLALFSFVISASAVQIQSGNPAFFDAGLQGCMSTKSNADGSQVVIHNCNNQDVTLQDWTVAFYNRYDVGPQQLKIFGDKCLDVKDGLNADGTSLQIWTCDTSNRNQNQLFTSRTDQTFQWVGTDKCVDLKGGAITDNTPLQIWTCDHNGNPNQQWQGERNPYQTVSAHIYGGDNSPNDNTPFCIVGTSNSNGASVVLTSCGLDSQIQAAFPGANSTWGAPVAPLSGTISTFNNKCLDVPNGSKANGVKLQLWTCAASNTNQMFTNHRGQIEWTGTGKCLDLTNGVSANGTQIQLWDCDASKTNFNQDWAISEIF
ncbi:hypothetical protein MIND_00975300 [Mycena indigotica]|uniref:Ricin B lectin domain-containing protein n=1 Tax=Mycena indigotica TaxID=2126181 RepID=A0A8H6SFI1_9AGAR|nr:uncharacterized protein MIND_00975300 [Mycena indigotica]KAF7297417.1 hypothetical protein MIND_00975300 [Mycena indigotica]